MLDNHIEIICLSEHWSHADEIYFLKLQNFDLINSYCRKAHIRGGVAIYVNKSHSFTINEINFDFICDEIHFECTGIVIKEVKLIIVCIYRSPNGNVDVFLEKFDLLLNYFNKPKWRCYDISLGGDVNSDFDVSKSKQSVTNLINLLRQYNFTYLNSKPTRGLSCLDNIFINFAVYDACKVIDFLYSDHNALAFSYYTGCLTKVDSNSAVNKKIVVTRPITNDKIMNFKNNLSNNNWHCYLNDLGDTDKISAKVVFSTFFNRYLQIFNECIPQRSIKLPVQCSKRTSKYNSKRNNWYTPQLVNKKQQVMFLFDVYKNNKTNDSRLAYIRCRNQYKKEILDAKKSSNLNYIESSSNKCKAAWKIINSVAKITNKDAVSVSPQEFNHFFIDAVTEVSNSIVRPNVSSAELVFQNGTRPMIQNNPFIFCEVSVETVLNIVKNFKPSESLDIYDISCNLVKKVIDVIVCPLTYCLNMCLLEGYFPIELKMSRVVPIYKKGDKSSPSSYRPISLVPVFAKILETIIYNQLSNHFECNGLLHNSQYGFRKGLSTVDAIDSLIKTVFQVFESKGFARATFCDLSKAFDCVEHDSLLNKISFYGVGDVGINLLKSYLQNRSQVVCVGKDKSSVASIKLGVPQGSVLGPFLFLVMINDLPPFIQSNTVLYADDTTFLNYSNDFNDLKLLVDNTISQASVWFRANGFLLNDSKTQQITFSLRDRPPSDDLNSVKFLGVYIDYKLTWEKHINYISGKLSRVIYLLRSLTNCVPHNYVRSSYFSFFQSILAYGILLWGNCSHVKDILILQKRAIRVITGSPDRTHCRPLFIQLKIMTVINLYIYSVLIYIKKKLPEMHCRDSVHSYSTRSNKHIYIKHYRLSKSINSYEVVGQKLFNKLPVSWQDPNLSLEQFKLNIYEWLLLHPFYDLKELLD